MNPRKCVVEGCGRPHNARGYCRTHYGRMIEGKSPMRAAADKAAADLARLEDLHFMAETGESLIGAAKRLGISERGLELWLSRHEQQQLAAELRSRNPRDPNALANREAVFVDPRAIRYRARKKAGLIGDRAKNRRTRERMGATKTAPGGATNTVAPGALPTLKESTSA